MARKFIFVEYINENGMISRKANNPSQAIVSIASIFTNKDGTHNIIEEICNLYVGKTISVRYAKKYNIISKEKINEFEKSGTKNLVINKNGIYPIRPYDKVFENENSMLEALNKQIENLEALNYKDGNNQIKRKRKSK